MPVVSAIIDTLSCSATDQLRSSTGLVDRFSHEPRREVGQVDFTVHDRCEAEPRSRESLRTSACLREVPSASAAGQRPTR